MYMYMSSHGKETGTNVIVWSFHVFVYIYINRLMELKHCHDACV